VPGVGPPWTDALATWGPGRAASDIQSSGRTKRANTFPLSPLPFSPEGDIKGFWTTAVSSVSEPEPIADTGRESVWFATVLELIRMACAANWSALAFAGRMAVRVRRAITAELSL
jgi:hypothetical protein